ITTESGSGFKAFDGLAAGSYSITESDMPAGWQFDSVDCGDANGVSIGEKTATIELAPGENVTCTYTNTKRATITIKKVTDPAGEQQSFAFTGDITASLSDGQSADSSVAPGTYHVTEAATAGWDLTDISCDHASSSGNTATGVATFVVTAGQHVT